MCLATRKTEKAEKIIHSSFWEKNDFFIFSLAPFSSAGQLIPEVTNRKRGKNFREKVPQFSLVLLSTTCKLHNSKAKWGEEFFFFLNYMELDWNLLVENSLELKQTTNLPWFCKTGQVVTLFSSWPICTFASKVQNQSSFFFRFCSFNSKFCSSENQWKSFFRNRNCCSFASWSASKVAKGETLQQRATKSGWTFLLWRAGRSAN